MLFKVVSKRESNKTEVFKVAQTKTGVTKEAILKIETPLINLSKAQIIQTGSKLGVDYSITISCYDPDLKGRSCGRCDSCLHRIKGFKEAGIKDPTSYYGF